MTAMNRSWIGTTTPGDYSVAGNWSPSGVPAAGDSVHLPAGSPAITAGLDQHTIALAEFVSEQGYSSPTASAAAYLQINAAVFRWNGTGIAYIDLGSSPVNPDILNAAQASSGTHGLYLKGTALGVVNVIQGDVGIADIFGETATATTVRSVGSGASVTVGAGVTLANFYQTDGTSVIRSTVSTGITVYGGTLTTVDAGTTPLLTVNGGEVFPNSSGTIAAVVANGGTTDWTTSGESRAAGTIQANANATIAYDPAVLTITTRLAPNGPIRELVQPL
jgi:hypothetical protein